MQPKMCTKCKKNIAVVFITKVENGVTMNEGYCLKCARSLGIPQIDQAVKQMGISEDDLDMLADEMSSMFGQRDSSDDADDDEIDSQTATFPFRSGDVSVEGEHVPHHVVDRSAGRPDFDAERDPEADQSGQHAA